MSITQFANSIRSSETTVQLLKDELRKEHETAANYLKETKRRSIVNWITWNVSCRLGWMKTWIQTKKC